MESSANRNPGSSPRAAWTLLRVWMGGFFLMVGLADLPGEWQAALLSGALRSPSLASLAPFPGPDLGGLIPIVQVVVGPALILGLFTPYAALGALATTVPALLSSGLDPTSIAATAVIVTCGLILARAGRCFGLDALLHRRMHVPLL